MYGNLLSNMHQQCTNITYRLFITLTVSARQQLESYMILGSNGSSIAKDWINWINGNLEKKILK